MLLKRQAVLQWILCWHEGKVRETSNLLQTACRYELENPLGITRTEVKSPLLVITIELHNLKMDAPSLCREHLLQ